MNSKDRRGSFFVKLGMSIGVLLLSLTQQAFAAGTVAGTDIDNLATVTYEVGGNLQDVVESAPGVGNSGATRTLPNLNSPITLTGQPFSISNRSRTRLASPSVP